MILDTEDKKNNNNNNNNMGNNGQFQSMFSPFFAGDSSTLSQVSQKHEVLQARMPFLSANQQYINT